MARESVGELLGEILRHDGEAYGPAFALTRANGVDPVDVAKLAIACEKAYHLSLRDEDIAQWHTLGDAAAHVEGLLEAGEDKELAEEETDRTQWFYA